MNALSNKVELICDTVTYSKLTNNYRESITAASRPRAIVVNGKGHRLCEIGLQMNWILL